MIDYALPRFDLVETEPVAGNMESRRSIAGRAATIAGVYNRLESQMPLHVSGLTLHHRPPGLEHLTLVTSQQNVVPRRVGRPSRVGISPAGWKGAD